ncbi:MAG: hypothetical protein ACI8QS_000397 [Planctomycetota bacterium]|jgi:hypothetical protein
MSHVVGDRRRTTVGLGTVRLMLTVETCASLCQEFLGRSVMVLELIPGQTLLFVFAQVRIEARHVHAFA